VRVNAETNLNSHSPAHSEETPLKPQLQEASASLSPNFWFELIQDLTIVAERYGADPKKEICERYILPYVKRKHPKNHRPNSLESKKPFKCPKCGHFHAHSYVIGKKPKRCYKCHWVFENEV